MSTHIQKHLDFSAIQLENAEHGFGLDTHLEQISVALSASVKQQPTEE